MSTKEHGSGGRKDVTNPSYCLSTAVSDAFLAATCIYGILNMLSAHWANFRKYFLFGYIWFGFCLFAASLGVMRFGKKHLPASLKNAHQLTSWIAGAIGTPALLTQFYMYNFEQPGMGNLHLSSCAIPILAYFSKRQWAQDLSAKLVSVLSILSLVYGGIVYSNMYAVAAAACFILAAPLDSCNSVLGIPCVDIFHYLLCIANILITKGLVTDRWELPNPDKVFTSFNTNHVHADM